MYRSARLALAASSLFLASVAGCSGGHAPSPTPAVVPPVVVASTVALESTATVRAAVQSTVVTSAGEPITSVSASKASSTLTSDPEDDADTDTDPASAAFDLDDFAATGQASKAAVEFIRALIASKESRAASFVDKHSLRLIDDWAPSLASMPNARVIDAVILSTASGRAVVAVSIASPVLSDGLMSEPIAYFLELSESPNGSWLVTGMSFA